MGTGGVSIRCGATLSDEIVRVFGVSALARSEGRRAAPFWGRSVSDHRFFRGEWR